ncbi:MAG: hypothetical protein Kow00109_05430 [Acidobacteriota bacterium]
MLATVLVAALLAQMAVPADRVSEDEAARLQEIQRDSRVFEKIVAELLRQNFQNPFSIAAEPRSTYLPRYGLVLSFHLKLNRAVLPGLGAGTERRPGGSGGDSIDRELAKVRDLMLRSLGEYGGTLKHLADGEWVSLCAYVEDRSQLDPVRRRHDLAVSVQRRWIDEYARGLISWEGFVERAEVLEY